MYLGQSISFPLIRKRSQHSVEAKQGFSKSLSIDSNNEFISMLVNHIMVRLPIVLNVQVEC